MLHSNNNAVIETTKTPQSVRSNSWAKIAGTAANNDSSEVIGNEHPSRQEVAKQPVTKKHVLLLEPIEPDSMATEDEKKMSMSAINDAMSGVNVEFCSVRKSGIVAIGFKDSNAKKLAEEKLKINNHCSSVFSTRDPKKLVPKVTVPGINEVLFDACNKDNMVKIFYNLRICQNCLLVSRSLSKEKIFEIEKKIQSFIKKAYIILDLEIFFPIRISIKKKNFENLVNISSLNYLL